MKHFTFSNLPIKEFAEGIVLGIKEKISANAETIDPIVLAIKEKLSTLLQAPPPPPRLIREALRSGYVISFDGTKIYWELHGPTENSTNGIDSDSANHLNPIVLCYGLVCSMNQWRAQLDHFSKSRYCLLVDYRGHHRSETPTDSKLMNVSAIAKDVAAAIREQKFSKPAHVWGHSMGCNVAIELAANEADLVASLVLCCGTIMNPFRGMFNAQGLDRLVDPILKEYQKHPDVFHLAWRIALAKPEISKIIAGFVGFNEKASRPEDTDAYVKAVASINPKVFFPTLLDFMKGMTAAIAPKVQTPVLVVAGAQDHVTPPAAQKAMADTLPKSLYMEVPTGSHNVQLDFGEYVCMKAESFWAENQLK